MNGQTVYTNREEGNKRTARSHFEQMEDANLMDKWDVVDHESKLEWKFTSVWDAIQAAEYLANHFEYIRRF